MRSAQSTQHKESELRNSRSCHICLKKQAEKNAACTVNSAERALWAARADSPPLNQILKDQVTNWKKSPSILKIIPLTKLLRCGLERLNKITSRHLHLVPACHMFESTFKNQASTALEEAFSQIQNQASTALEEITRIQKILQPSSRSKLWKVNKRNKIRADSSTTKAKDHLPHEAPCGPISTFKIKSRRPLKKFQTKVQEQASTALEEISSPIQDQASTALEEISSPIQDQASTALGSTSTVRDFKTHLLHVTITCIRRALKWGHFSETPKLSSIQVPEESRKCSSFFVHRSSKIKPRRPLDQQSSTFKIKPRRPLKKAFFVLRSSFFQDQAPTALWINNHPPIQDQAPTALEESTIVHHPFIQDQAPTALWINNVDKSTHPTVLQDQAQKPLKIRSSLFFKVKPKSPWRSVHHCSSKIKPKSPFEDPLKSTFKIKSTALEERIFRVHSNV
ncbi:hypothetical protein ACFX2H_032091 [Malus domestica]